MSFLFAKSKKQRRRLLEQEKKKRIDDNRRIESVNQQGALGVKGAEKAKVSSVSGAGSVIYDDYGF